MTIGHTRTNMNKQEKNFFAYKNKPLVRNGNTIYYGSMLDDYVVMLQIINTRKAGDTELADKITVQLMRTDTDVKPQDVIVKKGDKNGLSSALELADIWLNRALAD